MMESWSRSAGSVPKWLFVVSALSIFSFLADPGFLRMAQAQEKPSAQLPPTAQTPAPKTAVDGTWQGTLHAGQDLRIVMKFSSDSGALKATMFCFDRAASPLWPLQQASPEA